MAANAC